jgi:Mg-chelatase subunit ChlD
MPIAFETPQLLLLALPVAWLWWEFGVEGAPNVRNAFRATPLMRLLAAVLLVFAMSGPKWIGRAGGTDLLLVLDRSLSMPPGSDERLGEIIGLAEGERDEADRVGVVSFGASSVEEKEPSKDSFGGFTKSVDRTGSDLAAALDYAALLASGGRRAHVLVVSDGEYTGRDPAAGPAALLAARGVPVSFRHVARVEGPDAAAVSLDMPESVEPKARYQFSARVWANRTMKAGWTLFRDGAPIANGTRELRRGENVIFLRDVARRQGLRRYEFEIAAEGDGKPENDRALGALRVEGPARVLVVNSTGSATTGLAAILRAGGLEVDAVPSRGSRLSVEVLDAYRAVCLENVPAGDVGAGALANVRRWVESSGTGLLVTGGRSSFGAGGYFHSPLDEALPVSMELREEIRKYSVALVNVLDRSGSMAMDSATPGRTKMDLAALGAAATIEMLSDYDEVGVIAVDSSAHIIQRIAPASNRHAMIGRVRSIKSMGGGIYVYTGLLAGSRMLSRSDIATKHLILFADAADAEEPGEYVDLLQKMQEAGMTVSVIGLGSDTDCDAAFLKDVAKRGGGEVYFTQDARDLPLLFSQEVTRVARASFVQEETAVATLPGLLELGTLGGVKLPSVGGFNVTFPRPGATVAAVTVGDEEALPVLAFWRRSLGRVAALTVEADGASSGRFAAWKDRTRVMTTLVGWLAGSEATDLGRTRVVRRPGEMEVRFEIEPGAELAVAGAAPRLAVIRPDEQREAEPAEFEWRDERTLVARVPLAEPGVYLPAIDFAELGALRASPVSVSYAAEFLPQNVTAGGARASGREVLESLARATGGAECVDMASAFRAGEGRRPAAEEKPLDNVLAAVAVALLVLEIAGRRLGLWARLAAAMRSAAGRLGRARPEGKRGEEAAGDKEASAPAAAGVTLGRPIPPAEPPGAEAPEGAEAARAEAKPTSRAAPERPDATRRKAGLGDALKRAKSWTRRKKK